MPAQKGKDLLLKVEDGEGFVTIGGLRTRTFSLGAASIDVTHSESEGRWRELLIGAGTKRASLSGAGVFMNAASDALARTLFFAGEIRDWQVIVPSFGTMQGKFQITSLDYRADHQGEVTFELALESAGAVSFVAEV